MQASAKILPTTLAIVDDVGAMKPLSARPHSPIGPALRALRKTLACFPPHRECLGSLSELGRHALKSGTGSLPDGTRYPGGGTRDAQETSRVSRLPRDTFRPSEGRGSFGTESDRGSSLDADRAYTIQGRGTWYPRRSPPLPRQRRLTTRALAPFGNRGRRGRRAVEGYPRVSGRYFDLRVLFSTCRP